MEEWLTSSYLQNPDRAAFLPSPALHLFVAESSQVCSFPRRGPSGKHLLLPLKNCARRSSCLAVVTSDAVITADLSPDQAPNTWRSAGVPTSFQSGRVVEIWRNRHLCFGIIVSTADKRLLISLAHAENSAAEKIDVGEIVCQWPAWLKAADIETLSHHVDKGLELIRCSQPRTLNLNKVWNRLRKFRKGNTRGVKQSWELASDIFPLAMSEGMERRAAAVVATAILISRNDQLFKRGPAGCGWRALPASVTNSRQRDSFVEVSRQLIDAHRNGNEEVVHEAVTPWQHHHQQILRALETAAAGGSKVEGAAATALRTLGYGVSGSASLNFLYDVGYWSRTGDGTGDIIPQESLIQKSSVQSKSAKANDRMMSELTSWSCSPEVLAKAGEVQALAHERRMRLLDDLNFIPEYRKDLRRSARQRVYCVDGRESRFYDDAISVEKIGEGAVIRISVHVADVDETVKAGSAIDNLARERGKSLYFPLNTLHMIPVKAMEAACFSPHFPSEAITVSVEIDIKSQTVREWEIHASIVPPVMPITYEDVNNILTRKQKLTAARYDLIASDILNIAEAIPAMMSAFDRRKRDGSLEETENTQRDKGERLASVKLLRKGRGRRASSAEKNIVIKSFKKDGAHALVANLLASTGFLFRKYASQNNVALPEPRGAEKFASRCGTAPLRRYSDLAIQRQIKALLMHRQPAGRRRMQELRVWLAKRHAEGSRAVADQQKITIYDSFAAHCEDQKRASGLGHALVRGRVTSPYVQGRRTPRVMVKLDNTGITVSAVMSNEVQSGLSCEAGFSPVKGSEVEVKVLDINLKTFYIRAEVIKFLSEASGSDKTR